ncbi:MAG: M23 family metallopeptidase [Bacteroidales bacterium]|nr:M23 family metallopeptidase [Bacteroidales bacterium]
MRNRKEDMRIVGSVLRWFFSAAVFVCLYHLAFVLVFPKDSDRIVMRENRMYEKLYSRMREQERLLHDAVEFLEIRDDEIYNNLFNTSVPSITDLEIGTALPNDGEDLSDNKIYAYAAEKAESIEAASLTVEENFRRIFEITGAEGYATPPMVVPVEGFTVSRTGASVGPKVSPFYKVSTSHDGLDLIAPVGTAVLAGGPGVVMKVVRSIQADGNTVFIDHGNGYVTRYSHLGEIKVGPGRKVKAGEKIGTVGMSGKSFAPHLHYTVMRGNVVCDPVNFMFASVSPMDYAEMLVLSSSTAQQMD